MQLKCEHQGLHVTFLDLDITAVDGIYEYKLYNKRDNHPCFIVLMPGLRGNIPAYVFNESIQSEFLKKAICTLKFSDFVPKAKQLFWRMVNQGANQVNLLKQIKKAMTRHPISFNSFSLSSEENNTNILDQEWNRLVASDQCCWGAINISIILILNPWNKIPDKIFETK